MLCNNNITDIEGYVESPDYAGTTFYGGLDCTYTISVYVGYGIEVQVRSDELVNTEEVKSMSEVGIDHSFSKVFRNRQELAIADHVAGNP